MRKSLCFLELSGDCLRSFLHVGHLFFELHDPRLRLGREASFQCELDFTGSFESNDMRESFDREGGDSSTEYHPILMVP
jgi:hypothetical protein